MKVVFLLVGRDLLVSSHAGTRLPIAAFVHAAGRSPSGGLYTEQCFDDPPFPLQSDLSQMRKGNEVEFI